MEDCRNEEVWQLGWPECTKPVTYHMMGELEIYDFEST